MWPMKYLFQLCLSPLLMLSEGLTILKFRPVLDKRQHSSESLQASVIIQTPGPHSQGILI